LVALRLVVLRAPILRASVRPVPTVMLEVEPQPDREIPLPRGAQRHEQARERTPALRPISGRPPGPGTLGSVFGAAGGLGLSPPRGDQGLVLRIGCRRPPVAAGQALSPLDGEPVHIRTPEKPAPAPRPHRRQTAIVR